MTRTLPVYLTPPRADHARQAADPSDPKTWEVSDWVQVGGIISAGLAWIWRHTLKAWLIWICDWFRMPNRIRLMQEQLHHTQQHTTAAIAMARATWDTLTETPVWQSDALGNCVHVSRPMLRILQRQASEILGDNWRQMIYQPDRPLVYGEWDACIRDKRDFDLTYHWVTGNGEAIKIHANANRILSTSGQIIGWVSFVTLLKS